MKANELMIGDWVQDITPCVIDAISNEDICTYRNVNGYITANPSNLKPIPLTAEILEKNGFVRSNVFVEWKYERNGIYMLWKPFPWLQISTDEAEVKFECGYVHELQHALRLCGLKDLADNFKV